MGPPRHQLHQDVAEFLFPATSGQKLTAGDNDHSIVLSTRRISCRCSGKEWEGCVVRISGGNDKQGLPMKQGILTLCRVLVNKGHSRSRPRRTRDRGWESLGGCIADANLSALNLVIVELLLHCPWPWTVFLSRTWPLKRKERGGCLLSLVVVGDWTAGSIHPQAEWKTTRSSPCCVFMSVS